MKVGDRVRCKNDGDYGVVESFEKAGKEVRIDWGKGSGYGATTEDVAAFDLDFEIVEPAAPPAPPSVLTVAASIVDGPRREHYGDPKVNHGRTAAMWNAYLEGRLTKPLTARDVCLLNILQKASRDAHSPQRDNLVDVAGYARNAELVSEP